MAEEWIRHPKFVAEYPFEFCYCDFLSLSSPTRKFSFSLGHIPSTKVIFAFILGLVQTFETIVSGSIPIIQSYAVDLSYRHLPVVIVKNITSPDSVSEKKLIQWRETLGKYYEDEALRKLVLGRLRTAFWWGKVEAAVAREQWVARDGLPEQLAVFAD